MLSASAILKIKDFESLVYFLSERLDWPINLDLFENIDVLAYDFDPAELGINEKYASKIRQIKQLRPISSNQPWNVFWLGFDTNRLPLGVLRRVLSRFVAKRRSDPNHQYYKLEDLLFVTGHGANSNRCITFAHFHKDEDGHEVIRDFSWDQTETHFNNIQSYLSYLAWKDNLPKEEWRQEWLRAFRGSTRQAIRTAEQLAKIMAVIARDIRDRVNDVFEIEIETGPLHSLYEQFRASLIHEMTPGDFADMYAQTITYGLFSARCMDDDGHFELKEAVDRIPNTNPFLKSLFSECFNLTNSNSLNIDLDELGINNLVSLLDSLNEADGNDVIKRILEEFGRQTGNDDPVIHFFEGFMKEYDSEQRIKRGEYYTPDPVVSFIVRSVHELIIKEFGLPLGLADYTTWGEMVAAGKAGAPQGYPPGSDNWKTIENTPFITILDFSTGTGTFLKYVIKLIDETMKSHWQVLRKTKHEIKELWNDYVDNHLLDKIFGFELKMAPYAICHMKLGLVLQETGYAFGSGKRLNVYLTNTLEQDFEKRLSGLPWLANETVLANNAKLHPITIIMGNPPYSVSSSNKSGWIQNLIADYKKDLNEKKLNLDDDYIKFIRYGEYLAQKSLHSILGIITNNSFIDGVTHRQMRKHLLETFEEIYIMDLHGSAKKKETAPDGGLDQNVFDIMQGVSINIFIKKGDQKKNSMLGNINHHELFGKRVIKYNTLSVNNIINIQWLKIFCEDHLWYFIPKNFGYKEKYVKGFQVEKIFEKNCSGVQTDRDKLFIDDNVDDLENRIKLLLSKNYSKSFEIEYNIKDSSGYNLLRRISNSTYNVLKINNINYRPFDIKKIYYDEKLISRAGFDSNRHLLYENIGLIAKRGFEEEKSMPCFSTKYISDRRGWSRPGMQGAESIFPLYLYPDNSIQQSIIHQKFRKPNLNIHIINEISNILNLVFTNEKEESKGTFSPIDILDYIYAVLHSPSYREKYKEFLKIDFPRVPYPPDAETFWSLVEPGSRLRQYHLMEHPEIDKFITEYRVAGSNLVEKPKYEGGSVWINKHQYFSGVPQLAWEFYIGGYQPAQKWLKDRKGRTLTDEDIKHYQRIIVALTQTHSLMQEIDELTREWI